MNQAWTIFCLILAAALFIGGYEVRGWKDGVATAKYDEAQQQVTIAAEQKVIKQVDSQNTINQKAENDYEKGAGAINDLYDNSVQPTPAATSPSVRPVPAPACGPQTSRRYHLTLKQCDLEESKFNALWNAWVAQAAVK